MCQHYYSVLVAIAYGVLGDHQLAEDAAQEAFVRALVNLRKLKSADRFAPWLGQICRHVAIDMARTRVRERNDHDVVGVQDNGNHEATNRVVRKAIGRLPASMKEVVILRYYNHCSYDQISAVLGLSRSTINGRLTRAKRKLAKHLRRERLLENTP